MNKKIALIMIVGTLSLTALGFQTYPWVSRESSFKERQIIFGYSTELFILFTIGATGLIASMFLWSRQQNKESHCILVDQAMVKKGS